MGICFCETLYVRTLHVQLQRVLLVLLHDCWFWIGHRRELFQDACAVWNCGFSNQLNLEGIPGWPFFGGGALSGRGAREYRTAALSPGPTKRTYRGLWGVCAGDWSSNDRGLAARGRRNASPISRPLSRWSRTGGVVGRHRRRRRCHRSPRRHRRRRRCRLPSAWLGVGLGLELSDLIYLILVTSC